MSADGRLVAVTLSSLPANQFVLFDINERHALMVDTPGPYVGDFGWSPDGDELTFVTAERHTLGGEGHHVWRLRPGTPRPVVELLALIPLVRSPVLSADGEQLAAFEGVVLGDQPPYLLNTAHAIFERRLTSGLPTRRTEGHARLGGNLEYDLRGTLYIWLPGPRFPHAARSGNDISYHWRDSDDVGRQAYDWRRDIGEAGYYFRLEPGEILSAWPSPTPVVGAPRSAFLMGPLDDGRIAMYAGDTPSRPSDWYDEYGQARPNPPPGQPPWDYVAYAEDGTAEVLVRAPLPEGAGLTAGADLSSNGSVFAQVINRRIGDPEGHALMVFVRGSLAFEAPVSELVAQAERMVVAPSDSPLMPAVYEPHRLAVDPLP